MLSFGYAPSVSEVDVGLDNLQGTLYTRPDAPPQPPFMYTEQRSASWKVQPEVFTLMALWIANPDRRTGVEAPPVGINTELYPIRYFSQIEVTVARELVKDDVR